MSQLCSPAVTLSARPCLPFFVVCKLKCWCLLKLVHLLNLSCFQEVLLVSLRDLLTADAGEGAVGTVGEECWFPGNCRLAENQGLLAFKGTYVFEMKILT